MAHNITQPLRSLLVNGTHRFATCWKIELVDGGVFRFTDHDSAITIGSETFSPAGSFSSSARQRTEGLEPQNLDIIGVLDASSITEADLRSGRFRNAKLTEMLVDHRFPFAGKFSTNIYYVKETTFDNNRWTAKLEGMLIRLKSKIGAVYEKTCRWKLGDGNCGVSLAGYSMMGTVDSVLTARLQFTSDVVTTDGFFDDGTIVWILGENSGITSEVQQYGSATTMLHLQTPFPIASGDTFVISPGCDKTFQTCKSKFSNKDRFGGFPHIPGSDKMITTPG